MTSFLFWNLRGVSNASTLERLKKLVYIHKVCWLAIIEPMVDSSQLESFRLKLGFSMAYSNVNSKISVLWKDKMQCTMMQDDSQIISMQCKHRELDADFVVVPVYAKCTRSEKRLLWEDLVAISGGSSPLLVGRDFNIVRNSTERLGGNAIDVGAADDFNKCIVDCRFMEMAYLGSQFTWKKARRWMWQRLDRVLCNVAWMDLFSEVKLSHLNREHSDHDPLLGQFQVHSVRKGCSKFQAMWIKHHSFVQVVQESWNESMAGNPMFVFASKLGRLKMVLAGWNKEHFGRIEHNLLQAEAKLNDAEIREQVDITPEAVLAVEHAKNHLNHLLDCEEAFWRQRSKVKWLQEGERYKIFSCCG